MNSQASSKQKLRTHFRAQRRALSGAQREHTALKIAERILALPDYQQAEHIGVYYAMLEEISLHSFILQARRDKKQLYLPVINNQANKNRMSFQPWSTNDTLNQNQYNIPEPENNALNENFVNLDIVLVPLLAFDTQGRRLGMGGGYYDRYFADHALSLRIGIAHSSQCSATLPSEPWDINCHAIVTEKELIKLY